MWSSNLNVASCSAQVRLKYVNTYVYIFMKSGHVRVYSIYEQAKGTDNNGNGKGKDEYIARNTTACHGAEKKERI